MTVDDCSHPWLRVTCGACGAAIDELRHDPAQRLTLDEPGHVVQEANPVSVVGQQKLFIVARGHPELVEQLKAVLGDSEALCVIEDRRRVARDPSGLPTSRTDLRRRVLEDEGATERPGD